jgi:tetratricopeptide (TPR) repeat protein
MNVRIAALLVSIVIAFSASAAEDRLAELSKLVLHGRPAEARMRLAAAAEEYRRQSDAHNEGLSLMLLGFTDIQLGDIDTGRANLQAASAKLASEGDFFTAWMALLWGAAVDMRSGNWEEAAKQHELTLAMLREAQESEKPFTLDSIRTLGPLFEMNIEAFPPALLPPELMKRVMLKMAEVITRDAFGSVLIELGQLDRAQVELERAGDASAMFFGMFDSPIATHMGELRRRQWKLDEARKYFKKALAAASVLESPTLWLEPMELKVLGKLADIELLSGQLPEALEWNDRALHYVRERNLSLREISLLQERAVLLTQANRYDDALQVLDRALRIAEPRDVCLRASILTDIGSLQMFRGNYGPAAVEIERAIEVYQSVDDPIMEGHAWTMLAEVYLGMGADDSVTHATDYAQALAEKSHFGGALKLIDLLTAYRNLMSNKGTREELARAAAALAATPEARWAAVSPEISKLLTDVATLPANPSATIHVDPKAPGMATVPIAPVMADLFEAREQMNRGDVAGARARLMKGLEQSPNVDMRCGYLAGIGQTYWQENNREEAIRWFRRAADLIDDEVAGIGDSDLLARYLGSERRRYFDFAIDKLAESGNVRDAFEYSERARARAFLQSVGNHRIEPRSGGADRLVREAESLRLRIAAWERSGSGDPKELEHARSEYSAVMRRVKTTNPEYASLTRIEPGDVDGLRASLPDDTTLVSYFLTFDAAHAWILDRDSLDYVRLPLDGAAVQRTTCWAAGFAAAGRGADPLTEKCDAATAEEVYGLFIAPLRDKLRKPRLLLVPHGVLHQIPFAALRDPKSERYLLEDFTLLFAPSASTLRFLRAKETPVDGGALVLGDPNGAMGNLAGAQREALAVARDLGTVAITGADATESLLFDIDGLIDLVHIGAHGEYNSRHPLFSRIALASGGGRDGNLQVHEILNELDFSGVNLVVLSACRTGMGDRTGGDDIVGLTQAVLYAGSPGVISTLWSIDDDAAAVLMEELYCRLLGGAAVADALREAQLQLLHSQRWNGPEYWGAFLLTGDPQGRFNARGRP